MLIGILSDTHDDMSSIKRAVDTFNARGVSHAIHAGDLVSPFTFELFSILQCNMTAIFGNNDGDKLLLKQKAKGAIYPQPFVMTFNEKRIVVVHEPDLVDALADSGHFDLVIYGHTHIPDVRRVNNTLIVNPGKTALLHKGKSTIALFESEKMEAEILSLS
jgi:putative phosphoesterase